MFLLIKLKPKTDVFLTSCTLLNLGVIRGVGAGLFNLLATFKVLDEPVPTGLLKMVQYLNVQVLSNFSIPVKKSLRTSR